MNTRKATQLVQRSHIMSVREAVRLHGDCWRVFAARNLLDSDSITPDTQDAVAMSLMERGILPRVVL